MTAQMYQGLYYLFAGAFCFISLLFIFRLLGEKFSPNQNGSISEDESWRDQEELTIVEIIEETYDIKTFRLKREGKNFPEFKAGQFLIFTIGKPEDKNARSYSISCGDQNRESISVSIKLLDQGIGSGWFHSRKVGDKVFAFNPSGHFTNKDDESKEQVYICGGIGVTPFISMIEAGLSKSSQVKMSLFYGMKTTNDLAFHDQLELWSNRHENFSYFPILSNSENDDWKGSTGYVNLDFIKSKIGDQFKKKTYYFCGPPIMTETIMDALEEIGVADEQLFSEKFASPASLDESNIEPRKASLEYLGEELEYDGKKTILEFLEDNGLPAPSACRVGVCGVCKLKCSSGDVEELADTGLTRSEKKQGYILGCVSRPASGAKVKLG